jgi:hypothetical protein
MYLKQSKVKKQWFEVFENKNKNKGTTNSSYFRNLKECLVS